MRILIAYDISDSKRSTSLRKLCVKHGTMIQRSVYEMDMSLRDFEVVKNRVKAIIDESNDSVALYYISSVERIDYIGKHSLNPYTDILIL